MNKRLLAASAAAAAMVLAGCGGGAGEPAAGEGSAAATPPAEAQERTLVVSAAASLTDVFTELETQFEADNPGVDVMLNFGGSSDLSSQIVEGAPADVFASANTSQMDVVADAGLVEGEPAIFVTNQLQIAVPPGNPAGIQGFADLSNPEIMLVVCAPQVPCGAATEDVEEATGVTLTPVSEEPDVRSVLSQVETGNADAGLVYVTDVLSAEGTVEGIDFPESAEALNSYPIATLTDAAEPELAQAFVELVQSADGQTVLEAAGFGIP